MEYTPCEFGGVKNRTGERFGRLTVAGCAGKLAAGREYVWLCKCDCGKEKVIRGSALVAGNSKSCGCQVVAATIQRNIALGKLKQEQNAPIPLPQNGSAEWNRLVGILAGAYQIKNTAGWQHRSAVYGLVHKESGKIYIGSAKSVKRRIGHHRSTLINGKHDNSYLQNAWQVHGADAFVWVIIEECQPEKLLEREGHWMAETDCANRSLGYNLDIVTHRTKHSEETKQKIRLAHIGRKHSEESKRKVSIANKGRKFPPRTPEQRENHRRASLRRVLTPEVIARMKAKMSLMRKGKKLSEEHKKKIVENWKMRREEAILNFIQL